MSYTYKYPRPAVTTDCVILTFHEERLKILLIRRGLEPFKGEWALPGGFLLMDESAEEGALRELREETGVTGCRIKQFHTFSAPGRDPRERVITIAFYALMQWQRATGADDAAFADWLPVDNLPPLAFDHSRIVEEALKTLRRDIFFEPVGFELLDDVFTMSELQKVYEAILGKKFDRRNFAKKMKHLDILEEETAPHKIEKGRGVSGGSPLPFLNIEENKVCEDCSVVCLEAEAPTGSWFENDSSAMPEVRKERPAKKRRLSWRLNRKRYDRIKDDDLLEF